MSALEQLNQRIREARPGEVVIVDRPTPCERPVSMLGTSRVTLRTIGEGCLRPAFPKALGFDVNRLPLIDLAGACAVTLDVDLGPPVSGSVMPIVGVFMRRIYSDRKIWESAPNARIAIRSRVNFTEATINNCGYELDVSRDCHVTNNVGRGLYYSSRNDFHIECEPSASFATEWQSNVFHRIADSSFGHHGDRCCIEMRGDSWFVSLCNVAFSVKPPPDRKPLAAVVVGDVEAPGRGMSGITFDACYAEYNKEAGDIPDVLVYARGAHVDISRSAGFRRGARYI